MSSRGELQKQPVAMSSIEALRRHCRATQQIAIFFPLKDPVTCPLTTVATMTWSLCHVAKAPVKSNVSLQSNFNGANSTRLCMLWDNLAVPNLLLIQSKDKMAGEIKSSKY